VRIRGAQLQVSVTVGIASGAADDSDGGADHLITRAAEVMRVAKDQRGRVMVADADGAAGSAARLRTRGALRGVDAVARGEIAVVFAHHRTGDGDHPRL